MVKQAAGQEFLLTIIYFELYYTTVLIVQLWVAGEGPTIEWSYIPRKTVREKRLSFRDHGDCILLYYNIRSGRMSRKLVPGKYLSITE